MKDIVHLPVLASGFSSARSKLTKINKICYSIIASRELWKCDLLGAGSTIDSNNTDNNCENLNQENNGLKIYLPPFLSSTTDGTLIKAESTDY